MVMELRGLKYEDRLRRMGLTNLELRRKRGGPNKIARGFEEVDLG